MKIVERHGYEYSIQKDGNEYRVSRTIKTFKDREAAQQAMIDLLRGNKTEEEVMNGDSKDLH